MGNLKANENKLKATITHIVKVMWRNIHVASISGSLIFHITPESADG